MTIEELLKVLAQEYPNGVSFDPMAVRLLRQKVSFDERQIEELKDQMFQLGDGLWFSSEMVSDNELQLAVREQATKWLTEYGCFSVERLFENYSGVLRHITTTEYLAIFLRHLCFSVAVWGKCGFICFHPPSNLGERLAKTAKKIDDLIQESDGVFTLSEIEEAMPYLTIEALTRIREVFLPEIHDTEVGGMPCWRNAESISLPEDFAETLTTTVDTLVELEERVTAANIAFALNLVYRVRFREEYDLLDNGAFMRVCAKHYQGGSDVFPNVKKSRIRANDLSIQDKRVRSPNTRFSTLGVSIGTKLVFAKDSQITCIVKDSSNQVEYGGKVWSISALASHLLNVSPANGFSHFICEGETLWNRRLRLERDGTSDDFQESGRPLLTKTSELERQIIGLEGRALLPTTWRAFKSAGTNRHIAEWEKRVENGESVEKIARESGFSVSTIKVQMGDRRRYFKICEINKIMPEGCVNV